MNNRGLTLIEMLLAMLLASIAFSALASVVAMGVGGSAKLQAHGRLKEELLAVSEVIKRDLRRAGYMGTTEEKLLSNETLSNPFVEVFRIASHPAESAHSCIEFAYDVNSNGRLDESPQEYFGFRLRQGEVELRQAGIPCEGARWQDLTSQNWVQVTNLSFTITEQDSNGHKRGFIAFSLTGHLRQNPAVQRVFTQQIELTAHE